MGHRRKDDPPRDKRNDISRRGVANFSLLVILTFTVTINCVFWQASGETVEGFGDFIELPVSPYFNLPNVASNYRALSQEVEETTTQQPPSKFIDFKKPKISLSVIQLAHGTVESSKTILEPTESNVTKVIDEGDVFTDYNEVDDGLDDIYRVRPGERGGLTPETFMGQKVLRLECTANFPVEFSYDGFGVR